MDVVGTGSKRVRGLAAVEDGDVVATVEELAYDVGPTKRVPPRTRNPHACIFAYTTMATGEANPRAVETSALYVQIPKSEAEKLDRAAFELKSHKRDLVAALVARYVDPSTPAGLDRLRALGAHSRGSPRSEIPQPPKPDPRRFAPREPTVYVSRASDWVAGMRRSIRDFAQGRKCPEPLVRVTLDDGEQFFLQAMTPGPGDDFATFSIYEPGDEMTRLVVLHLDAIKKVEMLRTAPSVTEETFVFPSSGTSIGFTSGA